MNCREHGEPTFMSDCPYCLQDEIERLRAEIAGLRTELEKTQRDYDDSVIARDALRADAARYRWLRDVGNWSWTPITHRGLTADECDAEIDRARNGK